jgi:ABC-type transport system involved in multi-copper enzyme maturation permease subunit
MSLARLRIVFSQELSYMYRRPLFWFLMAILAVISSSFASGGFEFYAGSTVVGGVKPWLTSEFTFALLLTTLLAMVYTFFGSIASGMAIISDDEARISDMLLSTPLRPSEYVWGKFLAILAGFLTAFGVQLLLIIALPYGLPDAWMQEGILGPFDLVNYLRPALVFALPTLVFYLGVAFYLGERWRRPITVFLFPTALMVLDIFFIRRWTPAWLDPKINQLLMYVDPVGSRWINETWIKLDRGAMYYNTARIDLDAGFVISRLAFLGIGLLGVALAQRHLKGHLLGEAGSSSRLRRRQKVPLPLPRDTNAGAVAAFPRPLSDLRMIGRPVGLFRGGAAVAATELKNLLASPGLYLFGALIMMMTVSSAILNYGRLGEELMLTPGKLAEQSMEIVGLMTCMLLMFYTAESIERERVTGLAPLSFSTPSWTASFLFGKALANWGAAMVLAGATFLGCFIAFLIKGDTGFDLRPFLLLWVCLLVPTYLAWTCFILAVQAVSGQRYVTYGAGLSVIALSVYLKEWNVMTWLTNWWLMDSVRWTDMGPLELDGKALLLNRIFYLTVAVFFTAIAVRAFGRREADAIGTIHRHQPSRLLRRALSLTPYAVLPLVTGCSLWLAVEQGPGGRKAEKKGRDYWKQNFATWRDAPQPEVAGVDVDLEIQPRQRWMSSRGRYELINDHKEPLKRFALTGALGWEKLRWTLDGKEYKPEDRSGLYVFTPSAPLPPGGRVRVGWEFERHFGKGVSKNGGGAAQFILPSGVVMTSFSPSFVPKLGFDEGIGVKKGENDYEPKEYADDFYKGQTDPRSGRGRPFPTRISITGPREYTFNSVGTRVSEMEKGGQRTVVWKSDHPVRIFNIVGGRWDVRRGQGTAIYYHPGHPYNIDAMLAALDAARRHYSEWFAPFPWRELKISEFPNWAEYAQGFPTNIPFSEGVGFLTRSSQRGDSLFTVTAHEVAHQWWGNLLLSGEGPGSVLLSEGMAHYSSALLLEKVKGPNARMEFLKRLEERYGNERGQDNERPVVKVDNSRWGDRTLIYDKGAWIFWMMDRHLGRDRMLAGLQKFIADWHDGPDHPVLQDFTAAMRPFAPDPTAYDAFVKQWFHETVVPEYQFINARKAKARQGWRVTFEVKNLGTAKMPVDLAAVRGVRFDDQGKTRPDYREARTRVVLGAGEARKVEIRCPFEPEQVVADPDVLVLQLRRNGAGVGL